MSDVTPEKILALWGAKATARGAKPLSLIDEQTQALAATAGAVAAAVGGSEADRLDLVALLKLRKFSASAAAFTETNAWLHGLADTLAEIAEVALVAGGKLAAQALLAAVQGAIAQGEA